MDGPILIYNTQESDELINSNEENDISYEYQVFSDVAESNNMHTSKTNQYATVSSNNAENFNLCANTWMTQPAIKELEQLFNEWKFESLFPIFLGIYKMFMHIYIHIHKYIFIIYR